MVQMNASASDLATICRQNQVRELAVFGSAARGDSRPESDVDVLVEFQSGAKIGFLAIARLIHALEPVFGRPVDLALKSGLKPSIREAVLREAEVLFAEG